MFLINSCSHLFTAAHLRGRTFSRSYGTILPSSFTRVLSSALEYSSRPPVSVWGTVCMWGLFPGTASSFSRQPTPDQEFRNPSLSHRYWNINQFPIDYAFRLRLRGRLTLRRLTLRRNPWAFGEGAFHPLYRYSCQHSHFRYLQHASQHTFNGLRNAPLPCKQACIRSFGTYLKPR